MTDETYSIFAILGAIAAAGALWAKSKHSRLKRKFLESLTEEQLASLREVLERESQDRSGPASRDDS